MIIIIYRFLHFIVDVGHLSIFRNYGTMTSETSVLFRGTRVDAQGVIDERYVNRMRLVARKENTIYFLHGGEGPRGTDMMEC